MGETESLAARHLARLLASGAAEELRALLDHRKVYVATGDPRPAERQRHSDTDETDREQARKMEQESRRQQHSAGREIKR
jgi:hypothetical protein